MTDTKPAPAVPDRRELTDAYPLAALQAGMLFHSELTAGTATYHDLSTVTIRGRLAPSALAAALADAAAAHPVLRTSFNLTDFADPLQLVHARVEVPLTTADLSGLAADRAREELLAFREREKLNPIDWTAPPLLRAFAHRLPDERFALTLSFHHAILDGWSVAALTTELLRRYRAHLAGAPLAVTTPAVTYRDFVARELAAVADQEPARFWRSTLDGSALTALPFTGGTGDIAVHTTALDPEVAAGVRALAMDARVPVRTVLLAAHQRVLALVCGGTDVTTGVVSHNRPEHEAGGEVLGLFLNAVPLRTETDVPTWRHLVRAVFDAELAALAHRAYPMFEIQRALDRTPLFEVLFDYRDFHVYRDLPAEGDLAVVGQDFFEQTDVPFAVAFARSPADGSLRLTLTYQRERFPAAWVEAVAGHYRHALAELAAHPDADPRPADTFLTADLPVLAAWNATDTDLGPDTTVPALLAARAATCQKAVALRSGDERTSFAEFGARVARLTGALLAAGVRPGDQVGVRLPRGTDLLVAVHAVLAAGAVYLPLDPDLPDLRVAGLCAGTRLVVTAGDLPWAGAPPTLHPATPADPAAVVPVPPDAVAYVLHTSGSTGVPKAVAVTHRALVNRLRWMQRHHRLEPGEPVLHKTPAGFDVSLWELCWPLVEGATTVIAEPDDHRDTARLARLIETTGTTTVHFVPSVLETLLADQDAVARCVGLRRVICSGEALSPALARRCAAALPDTELHNLYGPTEAAIDVTAHRVSPGEDPLPIGAPVPNTVLHVLDRRGGRTPVGTPGELCIAGVQVALGYLGDPAGTADRFRPDPFGQPGTRYYRTGDSARWLPTGELDYLGRLDDQVKVRGVRIEPGEVEAALAEHPAVRAAAVAVRGGRLVAFVVAADEAAEAADLRAHLAERLAPGLVPSVFHPLDALPLGSAGKVDRTALPEVTVAASAGYRPPRDQAEARLATMWERLLGVAAVGVDDDFFELGGHSLLALRLTVLIRGEFGRELPVATVLTSPTVRALAAELRRPEDLGSVNPIVALRTTGDRPPLFLSHALGGQVFRYRPLAARLGEDQPVYTIPARGLIPGQSPHRTMAAMADDYVDYVRSVRPHGPYFLGGFCIGGNIALEVARRLRAAGEEVPMVFPVWSSADEPVVRSSLEDETMLMIHALAGGVDVLETVDLERLRAMSTDERLVAVVNAAAREERLRPDTADLVQARRYLDVFKANAEAVGRFTHDPYDGAVTLLQPTDDPAIRRGDDHGWAGVVTGPFTIAPIAGTRFTSVYEPLVTDMAAQMTKWMDDGHSHRTAHR